MNLFELVAKLTLDSGEFEKKLGEAETKGESFGSKFEDVVSKLATALTAAAITTAISKISQAFQQAIDVATRYADSVDKGAQSLGLSNRAYQEWSHALKQSGAGITDLSVGVKNLNSYLNGTASKDVSEVFENLGISATDASGNIRSTEDALQDVVFALANMGQNATRSDLVTSIFGRGGATLNAFLNTGEKGIRDLLREANELGAVMTDEEIANSVAYGDAIANMHTAMTALQTSLVTGLMPVLTDAVNLVTQIVSFFNWRSGSTSDNSISGQFEKIDDAAENSVYSIDATESAALALIEKMGQLGDPLQRTAEQTAIWKGLASELTTLIPELSGAIDIESGSLTTNTEDVRANITAWADRARQQALSGALADKQAVLAEKAKAAVDAQVESEVASAKALANRNLAIKEANKILESMPNIARDMGIETVESADDLDRLWAIANKAYIESKRGSDEQKQAETLSDLLDNIEELDKSSSDLKAQSANLNEELASAQEEYQLYANAINDMFAQATESASTAEGEIGGVASAIAGLPDGKDIYIRVHALGVGSETVEGFAKGLNYVPFDDFPAILHRGEEILTASQARKRRDGNDGNVDISALVAQISGAVREGMQGATVNSYLSGRDITDDVNRNTIRQLKARRFAT